MNRLCCIFLGFVSAWGTTSLVTADDSRPNILMIAIDDLRPELGAYGSRAITPAIDEISRRGLVFERAYCQQALCAPSRTGLMSGLRPGRPGITAVDSFDKSAMRAVAERFKTFPECLRDAGYWTMNVGKVYHEYETTPDGAWDVQRRPGGGHWQLPENLQRERRFREALKRDGRRARWETQRGHATEAADAPDENYQTHRIATRAIEMLRQHVDSDPEGRQPFMLSVGFYKPHLPFVAPKRYWDLYSRDSFQVPSQNEPEGISKYALAEPWYEMRHYGDIPKKGNVSDAKSRELIHGYHACVSFVDTNIQRLIDELDSQGLRDNTVIVLWSDHGWKLGDYGDWSKYTAMEIDTHIPMIFSGPGIATGRCDALVELIDLYPTLVQLGGGVVPEHVEATSLLPLLEGPARPWKAAALSFYDRQNPDGNGHSIRGRRYRYTRWTDRESGHLLDEELYDHADGPIAGRNLARDPEYRDEMERLSAMLDSGWRALRPSSDRAVATQPESVH